MILTDRLSQEILNGTYRIVLLSPEMLLGRKFVDGILRNQSFINRVYSVVIDEAHCISHWGADFRKKYAQIGSIRVFLPQSTPFIALSASLTPRVTWDIVQKLQLNRSNFLHLNLGNDRPNVSLIVRAIHNTISSYTDLNFVIPSSVREASEIPKTWIYADNINTGAEIVDHLRTLLPHHDTSLHSTIRPYNAVLDTEYRDEAMRRFKIGDIRILVCTDAAGMVHSGNLFEDMRLLIHCDYRGAMCRTLRLSYNGSYQQNSPTSSNVPDVLREDPVGQALQCFLLSPWHSQSFYTKTSQK
jgi:superfamily II DNA helicase RecQ